MAIKEQYFKYLKKVISDYCNSKGEISMYWDYRDEADKNIIANYINNIINKEPTEEKNTPLENILVDQYINDELDLQLEDEFFQYIIENSPNDEIKEYIKNLDYSVLIDDLYSSGYNGIDWRIDDLLENTRLHVNILLGTENERNYDMSSIVTAYGNDYETPFVSYDMNMDRKENLLDNSLTYLIHQQGYSVKDIYDKILGFSKDNTSTLINGIYTDVINNSSEAMSELGCYISLNGKEISDFCDNLQKNKYIVINKDTNIGLFNEWSGTCGYPDNYLEKDFVFPVSMIRNIQIEGAYKHSEVDEYTINEVCGLVDEFWAENSVKFTETEPKLTEEEDLENVFKELSKKVKEKEKKDEMEEE